MLAPSASSQEIFDQGFKYIFSTLTGNETVSVPIAKLVAAKNKDIKDFATKTLPTIQQHLEMAKKLDK